MKLYHTYKNRELSLEKKLIESRKDIKLIDIPIQWQDSFRTFMFGQSYYINNNGDRMVFIMISLSIVYKVSIDREIKINNILDEEYRYKTIQ
jgi:hypothetical protein